MPKPEERVIEQTIEIDAPVEVVWKALTEGEELAKWFPLEARVRPGVGGAVWMSWGGGMEGEAPITVWEKDRRLQTTEGGGERPLMSVDWYLEGKGGRTILRLVHAGFGADASWDDQYDDTTRGWRIFLGNLRHYLVRHRGARCRQIAIAAPLSIPVDEAWGRFTGPRGLGLDGGGLREGARYSATAGNGDRLEGVVELLAPPHAFGATVEAWNDAMLKMDFQGCGGGRKQCWFVFLTYGLTEDEVEGIRARWTPLLQGLFAGGA
jgi:uncharacterized protein YndB with AHSA1/START domain